MKMLKIMFHINSLGKGGAERVVSLLSQEFSKEGYQVVIATEWVEDKEYELLPSVRRIHVGLNEKQEQASSLLKQWFRVSNLRKSIQNEKPDVILSFCIKANYRATMATTGMKIPVITSVRSDPKVDYIGVKNSIINKLFFNRAAGCVFQTEEAQSFFHKDLQKKSTIICNPANEYFLNARLKEPRKKIVCVGRLVKSKNQLMLIRSFEEILKKYPDYHLYLYGGSSLDDYQEILKKYVEEKMISIWDESKKDTIAAKLQNYVHFMGVKDHLEQEIADAQIFVLPSDYEGMPNALMEAMAMGLPCISTDCPCGGSRYWIQHDRNGKLIPVGDQQALTKELLDYIEHPKKAQEMGELARRCLKDAELPKVYEQWKSYINQV